MKLKTNYKFLVIKPKTIHKKKKYLIFTTILITKMKNQKIK